MKTFLTFIKVFIQIEQIALIFYFVSFSSFFSKKTIEELNFLSDN